jgi:hypothetical protein
LSTSFRKKKKKKKIGGYGGQSHFASKDEIIQDSRLGETTSINLSKEGLRRISSN